MLDEISRIEVFYCMCWTEAGVKCSIACVGWKLERSVLLYVLGRNFYWSLLLYVLDGRWSEVFYCMCWMEARVKCSIVCVGQNLLLKSSIVCVGRKLEWSVLLYVLNGSWSEVFYCMCWMEDGVNCSNACAGWKLKWSVLLHVLNGSWSEVFYCMC